MVRQHHEAEASAVTIGIDPHKGSHTAAALDPQQRVIGRIRVSASPAGYRELRRWAAGWSVRRWAVENAAGLGRPLSQRLLGDGELVIDVPPKLSARIRVLSNGHGRKTDAADAVSTALAVYGSAELHAATIEDHATTLRLLSDRRDDLVARRTQVLNRLHALLANLVPGTVTAHLSADSAAVLLRRCRPAADAQRTRRARAGDLVREARRLDAEVAALESRIAEAVTESRTTLTALLLTLPVRLVPSSFEWTPSAVMGR